MSTKSILGDQVDEQSQSRIRDAPLGTTTNIQQNPFTDPPCHHMMDSTLPLTLLTSDVEMPIKVCWMKYSQEMIACAGPKFDVQQTACEIQAIIEDPQFQAEVKKCILSIS